MKRIALPEPWPRTPADAESFQQRLRGSVDLIGAGRRLRTVAGLDVAYDAAGPSARASRTRPAPAVGLRPLQAQSNRRFFPPAPRVEHLLGPAKQDRRSPNRRPHRGLSRTGP